MLDLLKANLGIVESSGQRLSQADSSSEQSSPKTSPREIHSLDLPAISGSGYIKVQDMVDDCFKMDYEFESHEGGSQACHVDSSPDTLLKPQSLRQPRHISVLPMHQILRQDSVLRIARNVTQAEPLTPPCSHGYPRTGRVRVQY